MDRAAGHIASIETGLNKAAQAARWALDRSYPQSIVLLETMMKYDSFVQGAEIVNAPDAAPSVAALLESYEVRLADLRATLDDLIGQTAQSLRQGLADLERDVDLVTIMLFGRTRTGKSTTMEALTSGDGASIGVGRQHTTKEIRAYYFPKPADGEIPVGPALRIVDTPGIEGFHGSALAVMAEEFVERSDHILFLLSDDKATTDELERFGLIRTQGKGVTILLNVKSKDENLDLLLTHPDLIFRQEELDGHARRISGYLERQFGMVPPRVITLHSRAAWLARRQDDLAEGIKDRLRLVQNSRLPELEHRIAEFIREEAVLARLSAPRDMMLGYLLSLKQELRPFAGRFRQMSREVDHLASRLIRGAERARARALERLPLLSSRFHAVNDAIPALIDNVIAARAGGAELDRQWRNLLQATGVTEAPLWFTTTGKRDFADELAEEVQASSFDYQFANTGDMNKLLGLYHEAEGALANNKFVKAGLRTVGGTGVAALAGWGIANFWNPTGWIAMTGAALLTVGAGIAGSEGARKVIEGLERKSGVEMAKRRDDINAQLRNRIWSDFREVKIRCERWIDDAYNSCVKMVNEVARPVSTSSMQIWQRTVDCLDELDAIADRIHTDLLSDLMNTLVPECASGEVRVDAVVREAGYRIKIRVSGSLHRCSNPIGACIGRQGQRISQLRRAVDNELVDFVDAGAPLEAQVSQALGLGRKRAKVTLAPDKSAVHLELPESVSESSVLGPRGSNIRLAKQLIGLDIYLHRKEQ